MKHLVRKVLSWDEYVTQAQLPSPDDANSSRKETRDDWYGGSFAEAVEMATGAGYRDLLPEADRLAERVEQTVAADLFQTTFASRYDVAGAEVDMGRFLSGEPECMIESTPIRVSRHGRAVRIAVPCNVSSRVTPEQVLARGAAVMALVDILARAQHPLEVWSVIPTMGEKRDARTSYAVLVQEANQPLDPGRLMYALAHPSMQRRLSFSLRENEPLTIRRQIGTLNTRNYGYPDRARVEDLPEAEGTTIILPPLDREEWDEGYAVAWIEAQLALIFD